MGFDAENCWAELCIIHSIGGKEEKTKKPVASSSEQGETASRSVTVLETEPAPVVEETKAEEEPKSVKATNGAAQKLEEEAVALKKKLKIWKLK